MGCDIHTKAQRLVNDRWEDIPNTTAFDCRSYGLFGFLAGVRNYSAVTPIAEQRGLPPDMNLDDEDRQAYFGDHSYSWLSMDELLSFDYDIPMEDRRVTRGGDGGCTANPGDGTLTTYREFLGPWYFHELARLKELGTERIVFGFDS
jgi:hypothetical protein